MEKMIRTIEELETEATHFINSLQRTPGKATLVTLSGELGAGKTAFTKAAAKALGVEEIVTSPSFVLEKIYGLTKSVFKRLIHIDVYRLEKSGDLAALGFDELLKDEGNLILLEWPEKVGEALPLPAVQVFLSAQPDGSHTISYGKKD